MCAVTSSRGEALPETCPVNSGIRGIHERPSQYPHARGRHRHRPESVVGGERARSARHRQSVRVVQVHASPPHRQVPGERERQAPRRLDADRLRAVRPHVESPRPRTRPRAGTRARAAAEVREQRPGHGASSGHGRGAGAQGRVPARLARHLEAGNRHAVLRTRRRGRGAAPGVHQVRAPGTCSSREAAHGRVRTQPVRGARHGRFRPHPPAHGHRREGARRLHLRRPR